VRADVETMRPGSRVHVAASSAITSARAFGQAVGEAERGLEVARTLNVLNRPLIFEHLGVYRILLGGGQQERDDFVQEALGPLREHDRIAGAELEATLRCYVDSDYNAAEAARRLYVHPNTLGHRLGHIRRLLGGDPARGDLRLQVELALKLGDLSALGARASVDDRAERTDAWQTERSAKER
jgi:DNA-binding PucR family transcriptional regulator